MRSARNSSIPSNKKIYIYKSENKVFVVLCFEQKILELILHPLHKASVLYEKMAKVAFRFITSRDRILYDILVPNYISLNISNYCITMQWSFNFMRDKYIDNSYFSKCGPRF